MASLVNDPKGVLSCAALLLYHSYILNKTAITELTNMLETNLTTLVSQNKGAIEIKGKRWWDGKKLN